MQSDADRLRRFGWNMGYVHIFVDPITRREDGTCEYDNYYQYPRAMASSACKSILEELA